MEGIKMKKSPQGCYNTMQLDFWDNHYNKLIDIDVIIFLSGWQQLQYNYRQFKMDCRV